MALHSARSSGSNVQCHGWGMFAENILLVGNNGWGMFAENNLLVGNFQTSEQKISSKRASTHSAIAFSLY